MMSWFKKKEVVEKPKVEVSVKGDIKFGSDIKNGWERYLLPIIPDLTITYIHNGKGETFKLTECFYAPLGRDTFGVYKAYQKAFDMIDDFLCQKEGNDIMKELKSKIENDVTNHIENNREEDLQKRIDEIKSQPIDIFFKFEL